MDQLEKIIAAASRKGLLLVPPFPEAFRRTPCSPTGVGAIGSYQSCDHDGKVQGAKDSFEDRKGTCLRRDRDNPSSAERSHGAETVIDEIEAVGDVMKISARIQIKGGWLDPRTNLHNVPGDRQSTRLDS